MKNSYVIHFPTKKLLIPLIILMIVSVLCLSIKPLYRFIYPVRYETIVTEMAETYSIPPSLIYAVIHTESRFDHCAQSSAGARGLMQITEGTYQWACQRTGQKAQGADILYDAAENIRYGVIIMHLLQKQFETTETVLAAYNAGQGTVSAWLKDTAYSPDGKVLTHIPYEETENYVRRVINTQKQYQKLYNIP